MIVSPEPYEAAPALAGSKPRLLGGLPLKGFLLLIVVSVIWGLNWPIMKIALHEIPVFTFRAICIGGGGLIMLGMARAMGQPLLPPRKKWRPLAAVSLFNVTGWYLLSGYGVLHSESGHAAIVAYTMPVWGVLLGYLLLREPLTWRKLLSLGLGMSGIALLFAINLGRQNEFPIGILYMLGAALCWAIGTVGTKMIADGLPSALNLAWQALIGGIPIFIVAGLLDYGAVASPSLPAILATVFGVVFPFLIAYLAYFEVIRLFPVGVATIGTLAIPVVGLLSGAAILGEHLGWPEIASLFLIVCAMAIPAFTHRRQRAGASAAP
jgi:drug/metabolite transporter (DMT)-like permease